ncbi:hypothetical protein [Burkholderia cenocepacia]|uniref:hypothetical protein n=1 Tax=Burkholderia cenocepacia TaxID=95486 RepID=UPI001B9812B2|nr:hypothetical protein [Burkholderia cenocepacia]MBR8137194.1 hypothetical protein [Burkholderia cenocepacia]
MIRGRSADQPSLSGIGNTGDSAPDALPGVPSSPYEAGAVGGYQEEQGGTSERGMRVNPENQLRYLYRSMYVDPGLRQAILDVRHMDRVDGRVKQIHSRVARDVIKGGLVMQLSEPSQVISRHWMRYSRSLDLHRMDKLKSDTRGLLMEGNLPLQWVLDDSLNVVSAVRMPAETITPNVGRDGRFIDVRDAYRQIDLVNGGMRTSFALWQLFLIRLDPDNYDDMGSMGRPYLDATRSTWRKLTMTEEDLVIRRRQRAPLRLAHVMEGATESELELYRERVESEKHAITTDFYLNKKGSVTGIEGDSNLDQIRDVVYLLDTFFAGAPLPKGLGGYTEGLNRDILEDLMRVYFDDVDVIQDTLSFGYEAGFRLHLLLQGINPDSIEFQVDFAERRTETPNTTADRALKWKALGLPSDIVYEELGFDSAYVRARRATSSPYPDEVDGTTSEAQDTRRRPSRAPVISITPRAGRNGDSATSISND